jgi:predicted dehydrogenase
MQARVVRNGRVRYAVAGAGWIPQSEFMRGVEHTGNSELCALVTGAEQKAANLGDRYGIQHTYSYEEYDEMLHSGFVDAVYLMLPNFAHVDFAVRALDAGVHLLIEKPMAVSVAQCKRILAAAERSGAQLRIACSRNHEPGMLDALRSVRNGEIGRPILFSSTVSQHVVPSDHRPKHGFWAGPVPDMGTYPINTARALFDAEPVEVFATGVCTDPERFQFDDTVAVTLRFPEGRVAAFGLSYNGGNVDDFRIVGTRGDLFSQPAYQAGLAPEHVRTTGKRRCTETFPRIDHFGAELKYFSECILERRSAESNGEDGLLDVRVIAAIELALQTGQVQMLEPYHPSRRVPEVRSDELQPLCEPELVGAENSSAA